MASPPALRTPPPYPPGPWFLLAPDPDRIGIMADGCCLAATDIPLSLAEYARAFPLIADTAPTADQLRAAWQLMALAPELAAKLRHAHNMLMDLPGYSGLTTVREIGDLLGRVPQ